MRLKNFQIREFRSVIDSDKIPVSDITCLVGKNESGKTTLLQALYRLNPVIAADGKFDITDDYPRAEVEEYQQAVENKKRSHAKVTEATFTLEPADLEEIYDDLGEGIVGATVTVSKGYAGAGLTIGLDWDEADAVERLVVKANLASDISKEMTATGSLSNLLAYIGLKTEQLSTQFTAAIAKADALTDAQAKAAAIEEAKLLAEPENLKWLKALLPTILAEKFTIYIWNKYLKSRFPKFLYFDEYYQMAGSLNLQKLKQRQAENKLLPSDRPMLGLIDLARLNLDQLIAPTRTQQLTNKLQGASNYLSAQVLKYWSQNEHIQLQFDTRPGLAEDPEGMREGMNLWGTVYDQIHRVSTGLGTRSRGFVWFFSFLAWYSQQSKGTEPIILLLDEPGLFLHASAQEDFLKFMEEKLKPTHQVIYSTHSPFLVDARHFDRVRIVEDKSMLSKEALPLDKQGTKVTTDVLTVSRGSLFPLQGALGYQIAQTLFAGPNCLIIEGTSDLLYIQVMSGLLAEKGRTPLKKEWTLTPVGGADKVPTFAALLGAQQGLKIATLIDFQKKDRQNIENLYKKHLLEQSHVLTFANFTDTTEADIEDLFEVEFYLNVVNAEYGAKIGNPLTVAMLPTVGERVLVKIAKTLADASVPSDVFDHFQPARYFAEHVGSLKIDISDATLTKFENAFKALNSLL